jgi:hypothetical protein
MVEEKKRKGWKERKEEGKEGEGEGRGERKEKGRSMPKKKCLVRNQPLCLDDVLNTNFFNLPSFPFHPMFFL